MRSFDPSMDELIYQKIIISDDEVDQHIITERNQSIHEISRDMEDLADSWKLVSKLINEQGESLNMCSTNVDHTVVNTTVGLTSLEKAAEYAKNKFIIARDIGIVVGGGLLGAGGFLLGPVVGIGTVIAGGAAGGAVVTGLHKVSKK